MKGGLYLLVLLLITGFSFAATYTSGEFTFCEDEIYINNDFVENESFEGVGAPHGEWSNWDFEDPLAFEGSEAAQGLGGDTEEFPTIYDGILQVQEFYLQIHAAANNWMWNTASGTRCYIGANGNDFYNWLGNGTTPYVDDTWYKLVYILDNTGGTKYCRILAFNDSGLQHDTGFGVYTFSQPQGDYTAAHYIDVFRQYNGTTCPLAPSNTAPVVNLVSPPTNDHQADTTPTLTFNVTDAEDDLLNCTVYLNGSTHDTWVNFNFTATPEVNTTNTTGEGSFTWNVNCTDGTLIGTTLPLNFTIDITNPDITWHSPSYTPPLTVYYNNINISQFLVNLSFFDTYLFAYNVTVYYPNGSIFWSNQTTDLNQTNLEYIRNESAYNIVSGEYLTAVYLSDDHTKEKIKNYTVTTKSTGFQYDTTEGNEIHIDVKQSIDKKTTTKDQDRYNWSFYFKKNESEIEFNLKTKQEYYDRSELWGFPMFVVVTNSSIHGNWQDLNCTDSTRTPLRNYTISEKRKENGESKIDITFHNFNDDVIHCSSLGGLNVNNENTTTQVLGANTLIINIYDEETELLLNNTNITITKTIGIDQEQVIVSTGTKSYLNLTVGNYTFDFEGDTYPKRSYTVTMENTTAQVLSVYLLAATETVVFTFIDSGSQATLENVNFIASTIINSSQENVSTLVSDITGRVQFIYNENKEYCFLAQTTNYLSKSFCLDPIIFSAYIIKMISSVNLSSDNDFSEIALEFTPSSYWNNFNNTLSLLIASPSGRLEYYGFNASWNTVSISQNQTSIYGGTLTDYLYINNSAFGDTVTVYYWYKLTTDSSPRLFKNIYGITGFSANKTTFANNTKDGYGMGDFEKTLIAVSGTLLVAGAGALYGGALASGVLGLFMMAFFMYTQILNFWAGIISIIILFLIVGWRSTQ